MSNTSPPETASPKKDEDSSSVKASPSSDTRDPAYFSYYAQFVHQQNMLQDNVRTSMYHSAIIANGPALFRGKSVMDIGAGSGILSYFAVQAGAEKVYAVEASSMANRIRKMLNSTSTKNTWMKDKVEVVAAKIEDAELPPVDTLISEPIGVLLVHERMIESYLYARDRFLKPGGAMIPSAGTIYLAPFTDANLWTQTMAKVRFWEQNNFFGVDFSPLAPDAKDEIFAQCMKTHPTLTLLFLVDFKTVTIQELQEIIIPFSWDIPFTGLVHGIAGWFDINLGGFILSTAPNAERTHWQQVRFLLKEPLAVNAYETVRGWMRLTVNSMRSYDVVAEIVTGAATPLSDPKSADVLLAGPKEGSGGGAMTLADPRLVPGGAGRRTGRWALHEQTYWYDQGADYSRPEFLAMYTPDLMEASADVLLADVDLETGEGAGVNSNP
ncbi:hypothetical protein HK104_010795 [Borealophlyctis nickersoniae]|nr:hypothetical protein HK104_010795 [Borealophlyctis nickersoniae]